MLPRALLFFRSFSFRAGALIFFTLCATLTVLRVQFYQKSLDQAYAEIKEIIEARADDIDQYIENNPNTDPASIIKAILKKSHDRHIYLALKQGDKITGNLSGWPAAGPLSDGWGQTTVAGDGESPDYDVLFTTIKYGGNTTLLIGYDLETINVLKNTLFPVLITNIVLSLLISLILSTGIVWMINRKLRQVNITSESIIKGDLSNRVPVNQVYDQFDKLGSNINKMLDWIIKLLDTVKYASNALAHDMRTPLSRHRIELKALSENSQVPEEIRQDIKHAVASVDTLADMFNILTSIAKAESGEGTEQFRVFDLAESVRDIVDLYEYEFEQNTQSLHTDIPGHPVQILGDKQLLSQAIVNLLDNASKYALAGATVEVRLKEQKSQDHRQLLVIVSDNGPGIPEEYWDKVKQRFFRLEDSRHSEGTGLGLSLVNAVAGLHGGVFHFEDNHPGLKAILRLPGL